MRNIFQHTAALLCAALAFGLASCGTADGYDYDKHGLYITGTESNPLVKFVVEQAPAAYAVTAQTTKKAESDVKLTFAIDNSLVETYNAEHGASFFPVPDGSATLENAEATIAAGSALSTPAMVRIQSEKDFDDARTYLIPVTIKSMTTAGKEQVIETSRTIYLKVSRVIQFTALQNDYQASSCYFLRDDHSMVKELPAYTLEIKVRSEKFGKGGNIKNVWAFGMNTCFIRFGENGYDGNQLQWVAPAGSVVSNTRFQTNRWYLISLVCDGATSAMYVDGVKDASIGGGGNLKFGKVCMGMSWINYRGSQFFQGRMCEVRIWERALSANEIAGGLGAVDPASRGLLAYWKMNEGEGHIFHDATGHGYDLDWSNTWREATEGRGDEPFDYSRYIKWVNDENNKYVQ